MKIIASILLFILSWSLISMAQVPVSSPVAVVATVSAPPAAQNGVMAWVESHGGFQAAVLLLVGSAFTILSALRQVLYKFDGIAPGADIPSDKGALTLINKICIILGKVIDFATGNTQH